MVKSGILAPQAGLEAVAILTKVVLVSGKPGLLAPRGGTGEDSGLTADGLQVLAQGVPFPGRIGTVGIKTRVLHPNPSQKIQ